MSDAKRLALDGGTPVRDVQARPWPAWPQTSEAEWAERIEPALREVYLSATEGLPGPVATRLGEQFAAFCQARRARLLVHGTDAIAAALAATLDLDACQEAGEIIVPNYTFVASASAAIDRRFTVAFVDVDPVTLTLDPAAFAAAVRPGKTTAVLPVHLAGHPADMARIRAVASRHGLAVVEDCAQAHGAQCDGRPVGAIGDAGAFSFQSSKNLTAGEGGVVTTDDDAIDERVVSFMNVGRHPRGRRWEYPRIGWNYRPSEYVAALLTVRLESLEEQTQRRGRMAALLTAHLADVPGVQPPQSAPWCTRHGYHLYNVLLDPDAFAGRTRDDVVDALQAEGIPAMAGYTMPLSDQPGLAYLRRKYPDRFRVEDCPNTPRICERAVWLPQQALLAGEEDMLDVAEAFAKVQAAFAGG